MFTKRIVRSIAYTVCLVAIHQHGLAQQSSASSLQNRLGNLFSSSKEDELLEPDQAFQLKVAVKGPTTLIAELIPANGYYLYKDRIRFSLKESGGATIKSVKLPNGEIKNDRSFGKMETYTKPIQAEITLDHAPKVKRISLTASYQGCHEKLGVCYPPIDKVVNVNLP